MVVGVLSTQAAWSAGEALVPTQGAAIQIGTRAAREWLATNFKEQMKSGKFASVWVRFPGCAEGLLDQVIEVSVFGDYWVGRCSSHLSS